MDLPSQLALLYALVAVLVSTAVWRDPRNGWRTSLAVGVMWLPVAGMLVVSGLLHVANWLWVEHVYPALFGRWRP